MSDAPLEFAVVDVRGVTGVYTPLSVDPTATNSLNVLGAALLDCPDVRNSHDWTIELVHTTGVRIHIRKRGGPNAGRRPTLIPGAHVDGEDEDLPTE